MAFPFTGGAASSGYVKSVGTGVPPLLGSRGYFLDLDLLFFGREREREDEDFLRLFPVVLLPPLLMTAGVAEFLPAK